MTQLNGALTEEDKIVAITKSVLSLMTQLDGALTEEGKIVAITKSVLSPMVMATILSSSVRAPLSCHNLLHYICNLKHVVKRGIAYRGSLN
jgi:hypothetical protein